MRQPFEGPRFFISGTQQNRPADAPPIDENDDIATRFIYLAWSDGTSPHPIELWLKTDTAKLIRQNGRVWPFFITNTNPPDRAAEDLKSGRGWFTIWNTEHDDSALEHELRTHLDNSGK